MVATLILARWVIPVSRDAMSCSSVYADDLVIDNGAVLVRDEKIEAVGSAEELKSKFGDEKGLKIVDLSENHVLIPGLINCHTHCAMSMLRGYADDLPLHEWLNNFVWPTEGKMMSPEFVYEGTAIAAVEAIKSGTTMLNDMYFIPDAAIKAFKEAGVRAVCSPGLLDFNDGTIEKQFTDSCDFIKCRSPCSPCMDDNNHLIRPSYTPHSLYTVDKKWHKDGVEKLAQMDYTYHTHLHESIPERETYETRTGESALHSLHAAGALTERFVGAHCVHMTDDEMDLLAKTKANVCHCPKSNLKLASGFCEVWKMMQKGVNVCLGTDGGCSNNSLDMLSEIQIAALLAKAVSKNTTAVDAYTALQMATRNGARALGRLDDLGSLEVGKLADVVAVDLVGLDEVGHPIYDPISHLVYTTHRVVTDVWIHGKQVMDNNKITTIHLDNKRLESLVNKIKEIRKELIGKTKNEKCETTPSTTTSG